jgi:hypothetical protein
MFVGCSSVDRLDASSHDQIDRIHSRPARPRTQVSETISEKKL